QAASEEEAKGESQAEGGRKREIVIVSPAPPHSLRKSLQSALGDGSFTSAFYFSRMPLLTFLAKKRCPQLGVSHDPGITAPLVHVLVSRAQEYGAASPLCAPPGIAGEQARAGDAGEPNHHNLQAD